MRSISLRLGQPPSPYSQNIVGYVNTTLPGSNTSSQINVPLLVGKNQVEAILPKINKGDVVSFWTGDAYYTLTFAGTNFDGQGHAWVDSQGNATNSPPIDPNRPFVYQNSGNTITNTFTGSIPTTNSVIIRGKGARSQLGLAIPISARWIVLLLLYHFMLADKVYIWNGKNFNVFTYEGANFDGQGHAFSDDSGQPQPSPSIHPGQAFFYQNNQDFPEIWNQSLKLP